MIREEIMRILNEDVKTPIEEECDDCPDVQKEGLGQYPEDSLGKIPGKYSRGEYVDPKLKSDFEGELEIGTDPTINPRHDNQSAQDAIDDDDDRRRRFGEGCDEEELEEDLNEDPWPSRLTHAQQSVQKGVEASQRANPPVTSFKDSQYALTDKDRDEEVAAEKAAAELRAGSAVSNTLRGSFGSGRFGAPLGESESGVRTPEMENALYESRFTGRDTKLFKKLVGKWAK